jgi:hypothetical protein
VVFCSAISNLQVGRHAHTPDATASLWPAMVSARSTSER